MGQFTSARRDVDRIENGEVYYWYKDYRDDNTLKMAHLPGVTFLETFLQHVLPPGIHNKRRYGFWGYNVRTETLTLIRAQLGVPPVAYVYRENTDDGDVDERQAPGEPRPRHCAICKEELDYVRGTTRPSPCTVWHMIWDEMVVAIDVRPESYRVRTWEERRREEHLAEQAARAACEDDPAADQHQAHEDKANRRRGPPPDHQRRLAFMAP